MTKKNFELIADSLARATTYHCYSYSLDCRILHALMCDDVATQLSSTNPRFDRVKFLRACNVSEEDIDAL